MPKLQRIPLIPGPGLRNYPAPCESHVNRLRRHAAVIDSAVLAAAGHQLQGQRAEVCQLRSVTARTVSRYARSVQLGALAQLPAVGHLWMPAPSGTELFDRSVRNRVHRVRDISHSSPFRARALPWQTRRPVDGTECDRNAALNRH